VPSNTPTNTAIPSNTPTNTAVPSNTPTNTAVPSATYTNTPVPSATPTNTVAPSATPTVTNTPLPPTATSTPVVLTIDNADDEFDTSGTWFVESSGTYPSYGPDFVFSFPGNGSDTATFTPDFPVTGNYEVFIWWGTTPSGATNQVFTINHADGSTDVTVNFRGPNTTPEWLSLGVYHFAAGTGGSIQTDDQADSFVGADAIQLVQTNAPVSTP
jgi:hypothetical protein